MSCCLFCLTYVVLSEPSAGQLVITTIEIYSCSLVRKSYHLQLSKILAKETAATSFEPWSFSPCQLLCYLRHQLKRSKRGPLRYAGSLNCLWRSIWYINERIVLNIHWDTLLFPTRQVVLSKTLARRTTLRAVEEHPCFPSSSAPNIQDISLIHCKDIHWKTLVISTQRAVVAQTSAEEFTPRTTEINWYSLCHFCVLEKLAIVVDSNSSHVTAVRDLNDK